MGQICSSHQIREVENKLEAEFWVILQQFIDTNSNLALTVIQNELSKATISTQDSLRLMKLHAQITQEKTL